MGWPAAALEAAVVIAHVGQEMFDCAEEKRAKAATLRIHGVDAPARQQTGEEFLSQITGRVFIGRATADESEHWRIVGRAQVAQGCLGCRRIPSRLQHARPAGGDKRWTGGLGRS
jgi:hypothetical protein